MKKPIKTSGFRKSAVARLTLSDGKGAIRINSQSLSVYGTELSRLKIQEPLLLVPDISSKIDVNIRVAGGGQSGQTDAIRLAIGRALSEIGGEKVRQVLTDYDRSLIVADTRFKEACKPNDSKARAKRQKSYR